MALNKEKAAKKQLVGVLIDIGNSETRVRVKYRPIKGIGNERDALECTFAVSNHYAGLLGSYAISPDYMNEGTTIIDINGVRIAHGELVAREFVNADETPSGKRDKSAEPITNWTLQLILIKTIHLLASHWGISPESVDVAFAVYCLLPPEEHAYNKDAMLKLIEDIDEVTEHVPVGDGVTYREVTYPILYSDIQAYPEGISAFFGIRVNIQGNKLIPNKDVAKYMKGYVLVIDVGAGTTDLAIMQDGILKADSRLSIADAGNHIVSALQRNVKMNPRLRGKIKLGISNIDSVMKEAMIREGDGLIEEDCATELNDAKAELASALANQIRTYANSLNVISMVKGILVVGGANTEAVRDGVVVSPALETFLIPKIKAFAEMAELIEIRNRDPRYLNLDGLESIFISTMSKEAANA